MKRRDFLKAGTIFTAPLMFQGVPVMAADAMEDIVLQNVAKTTADCGKILILIQLNGGNDGLNTVFPLDQWSKLNNARSNILMPESAVLKLDNNLTTGLHPSLSALRNMYNEGKLMIVQGVSYPNPSFSHFRATDIWMSASDSNTVLDSGWMGRALDTIYPNYPSAYPSTDMPDPLAIQIGSSSPFSLQGPTLNMGYNTTDPNELLNVVNAITDPAPNNDYGNELTFLRLMKDQSNVYANAIKTAYAVPQSQSATYPVGNQLADQLKIVAKLINGGLKTPVYVVKHPKSFDTHEYQIDTIDKTTGTHADNLRILSEAIAAFQTDIELMGKDQLVTGMTFSEFGRRIKSNASFGTDHGSSAPVFFFGAALNTSPSNVAGTDQPVPGMIGTSPVLPTNATVNDQIPMQFDYRQIYSTVLQDWLCMDEQDTQQVLGGSFARMSIFQNTSILPIELLSFTGEAIGSVALLQWTTASETNNYKFEIERSNDAVVFSKLGQIPGAGTSVVPLDYSFTDSMPMSGVNYYRLSQTDFDGTKSYSQIIALHFDAASSISVFPNPTSRFVIIQMVEVSSDGFAQVYNAFGQLMMEKSLIAGTHRTELDISDFPKGNYIVRVKNGAVDITQKVMKN